MIQLTPTVQNHLHYDLQERSDFIYFRALRDSPVLDIIKQKSDTFAGQVSTQAGPAAAHGRLLFLVRIR